MRIKELRLAYGMQQKELAMHLGIATSTLSQYENMKRDTPLEIVVAISKLYKVHIDYIYGVSDIIKCTECGLSYCLDHPLDVQTHCEEHKLWKLAREKYGENVMHHCDIESVKASNRNIVSENALPLEDLVDAQIRVYQCLFTRSLSAMNYSDEHVDFEEYVSMILHQPFTKDRLINSLYNRLVDMYGTTSGIPNGTTYYYPNAVSKIVDMDATSTKAVKIPVLGKVAAGIPIEAVEDIVDYEEITEAMARKGEYFGLMIQGDSMEPKFTSGDIVIVRKQDDAETGDIIIATVNGADATCKRLQKYAEGIALISTNPMYEPFRFTKDDVNEKPVRILGKVVELRAKF